MLPAVNRLKLSNKNKILTGGKKISTSEFVLIQKGSGTTFKAASVVAKKVAPKAVDRNRIKRLIAQALLGQKGMKGNLIIIVKKNIASLKMQEVRNKLVKLLRQTK